ncbi:MAG: hypothetical protein LLG00_07880 [Planctomycetaceae bacterium]|nr:hypothetical protein [Planctomycetaceae bacterium]
MNRWCLLATILAFPALLLAQGGNTSNQPSTTQPYQPAVPSPSTNVYGGGGYGGWGGYGASTAAGSALSGMAGVISAAGQRNLANSAAAVNMTQAQKNEIENQQQWTKTYFDMRATNKAATAAERGPRPTMEQMARWAKDGAPKPLNTSELNPVTGGLNWPSALQLPEFQAEREELDQLLAKQARYGALDYSDQTKVRQTIDGMYDQLKSKIKDIPPMDYVACRNFLRSVNYAATKTEM